MFNRSQLLTTYVMRIGCNYIQGKAIGFSLYSQEKNSRDIVRCYGDGVPLRESMIKRYRAGSVVICLAVIINWK